jgi:hypothetical protein
VKESERSNTGRGEERRERESSPTTLLGYFHRDHPEFTGGPCVRGKNTYCTTAQQRTVMFEPIRGGTRGGQAEFKWSDVSADKDREVCVFPNVTSSS